MLKSVWLSQLIVSSLNDTGSVLASYYRHLSGTVRSEKCLMILEEPDHGGRTFVMITSKAACLVPAPGIRTDEALIRKATKERKPQRDGGWLYCPLYFENVDAFGCLVFEDAGSDAEEAEVLEALFAFSSILYSESMGSIVQSFHDTAMRVENVCVDYDNGRIVERAVKNVSLTIYEKEFTMISGASGCGKSSLLNVCGAMRKPSEGTVWWRDTEVTRMSEEEMTAYRAETVGFVFQRYNLISDLTAEENVLVAASLVKDPLPAKEVLRLVGLERKAGAYPSQLSGGEQQRVCIARALVKKAKLLLCDEPTGALDTENAKQVITILKNIAKEQEIPVVVVTHNPGLVVLADHCITMSNGMISDDRLQPFALPAEELKLS